MSTTTDNAQLIDDTQATLDQALLQAEIHATQLAGAHPDPEAATAYRWVSVQLAALRTDAATIGGQEP